MTYIVRLLSVSFFYGAILLNLQDHFPKNTYFCMSMTTYFDLHTHYTPASSEVLAIVNVHQKQQGLENELRRCSVGLHPWFLNADTWRTQMDWLETAAALPQVWAIGECGLDRVCDVPWSLQQEVFRVQVDLAERLDKPLILHCVRAHSDLIALRRQLHSRIPWILHGFNKKPELALQMIRQGFGLSFGNALLSMQSSAARSFAIVPASSFFLETDDCPNLAIADVYAAAAALRQKSIICLSAQIAENCRQVFGKERVLGL